MHAAIFTDLSTIVFDDVATPTAGPGEVIVRVDAATICGTDLKIYRHGKKNVRPPQILGHEFAGTVVELGAGVTSLAEGQRVAIDPVISCGVCRQCLAGRPSLCPRLTVIVREDRTGRSTTTRPVAWPRRSRQAATGGQSRAGPQVGNQ